MALAHFLRQLPTDSQSDPFISEILVHTGYSGTVEVKHIAQGYYYQPPDTRPRALRTRTSPLHLALRPRRVLFKRSQLSLEQIPLIGATPIRS